MSNEEASLIDFSFSSATTYTFVEEIGRGGMGIVYLAERDNEGVRDQVVMKILKSRSDENAERLKREANIATGLRHENIVKTYGMESVPYSVLPSDFTGDIDNLSYARMRRRAKSIRRRAGGVRRRLAGGVRRRRPVRKLSIPAGVGKKNDSRKLLIILMDYIDGEDLSGFHREHLKKGLLIPFLLSAFIVSRICRALEYAHGFLVHRDISLENVLLDKHGVAKLTDFGIAVGAEEATSDIAGKIQYMSPEQMRGDDLDGRSDIFSLGLVAYELLTGIRYFAVPVKQSVKEQVKYVRGLMAEPIPAPHEIRPDIPKALSDIIARMLRMNRDERYQSAGEVGVLLEQKYLYATGFGPTNNSLASYIDIFDKGFKGYRQDQLKQLVFLKGDDGKIKLLTRISRDSYSPLGMELAGKRPGTLIHKALLG